MFDLILVFLMSVHNLIKAMLSMELLVEAYSGLTMIWHTFGAALSGLFEPPSEISTCEATPSEALLKYNYNSSAFNNS